MRELAGYKDLFALAEQWQASLELAESCAARYLPAWLSAWSDLFGQDAQPLPLAFVDADGLAGVAPLALGRRSVGPLGYRSLELAGAAGLAGAAADLLLFRRRPECVRLLLEWLAARRGAFEILELPALPEAGTTAAVVTCEARPLGLGVTLGPARPSGAIVLRGDFESFLNQRGRELRRRLNIARVRLEHLGALSCRILTSRDELASGLVEAVSLDRSRGSTRGALARQPVRAFLERVLPELGAQHHAYLGLVAVAGRCVAYELGLRVGSRLWCCAAASLTELASASPDALLRARLIEWAFSEKAGEYAVLGGSTRELQAWGAEAQRHLPVLVDSATPRARLAVALAHRTRWAFGAREP